MTKRQPLHSLTKQKTSADSFCLFAMTPRDSSRSPPVASQSMRPLPRRRRTGATAIAAGLLLAWQAVVGRTDACSVSVTNNYNVTISLHSYNGFDHILHRPLRDGLGAAWQQQQ
jgi:hypothetical protein